MCGGNIAIPPIVKEKRRNSEKRKEKSRDAARCRRGRESEIFSDLCDQLPLTKEVASSLDKSSIMRLTVGFLKVREMMKVLLPQGGGKHPVTPVDSVYARVLNGFLLVLSEDGDIIYLSANVDEFIGIPQVEMMGHSMYDFSHPCDHEEIKSLLASRLGRSETRLDPDIISFFIRMKSTMKSKGRTVNKVPLKSATYRVIHYIGHKFDKPSMAEKDCPTFYLVLIGKTIPHPSCIEVPLDKEIFFSRHSPDMKFTHIDDRISEFLGFKSSELIGKSVYAYHHALDATALANSYRILFSKGQCETGYYRFLSKYGGYVWVVTQATLIYDCSTKPECVVCLNYVLSKVENCNEIVASEQEEKSNKKAPPLEAALPNREEGQPLAKPTVLLSSTSGIFTPKASVMSKDFLSFPDTDQLQECDLEPPIESIPSQPGLKDILLYQEPLKDSKLNLELDLFTDEPCSIGNEICDDPFISYRDDSLSSPSYCGTPESSLNLHTSNSTSPDHFNTTPSTPDSGSLSDIPNLDPINEFSNLDLKFTMPHCVSDKDSDSYEDVDLEYRAPYISMSMDDDFPLISPSNSVMWGPQEPPKKTSQEKLQEKPSLPKQKPLQENSLKSSLAALLQSDVKKHPQSKNASRKDASHKKWPNNNNSSVDVNNNKNSASRQKHYNGGSQIIMLDSIPVKKHSPKSAGTQRRGAQASSAGDRHSRSSPFGSHTATVKVNDRLIKVQVSVSELPTTPIEHKQPFPSPPDPPPKRTSPSRSEPVESPKRLKVENGLFNSGSKGIATDSVLLNLLISGEDASRGYLCSGNSRYSENKIEPAVLSLPATDSINSTDTSLNCTGLLASESELLDSFLNITQYDAEVNAPIQSSHLLQGDDLLSALEHQPPLRNVAALV